MRPLLYVDPEHCAGCDRCEARRSCRTRAIVQPERGDLPLIEAGRCMGCLACLPACPHRAIRLHVPVPDVPPH